MGLAGLLGSGTGHALRRLFGLDAGATIRVRGRARHPRSPADAIRSGIGMVPGERRLGLIGNLSVRENILLPSLDRLTHAGSLDRAGGDRIVTELMELLDIRPRNAALPARHCRAATAEGNPGQMAGAQGRRAAARRADAGR